MKPIDTPLGPKVEISSDFAAQVERVLADADKLHLEEHAKLRDILFKHENSFAKDSLYCGLTDLHSIRIPTHPNAPPTYVCQYKIPLPSYEPIQEIIDRTLNKGII